MEILLIIALFLIPASYHIIEELRYKKEKKNAILKYKEECDEIDRINAEHERLEKETGVQYIRYSHDSFYWGY